MSSTEELSLPKPGIDAPKTKPKTVAIAYWIVTAIFCFFISFTAYAGLCMPNVAQAFTHVGFPSYFRIELSWCKFFGVAMLLLPVPPRLKEWVYAGFFIDLTSAVYAHIKVGDGPAAWGWAASFLVLWAISYVLWGRMAIADRK